VIDAESAAAAGCQPPPDYVDFAAGRTYNSLRCRDLGQRMLINQPGLRARITECAGDLLSRMSPEVSLHEYELVVVMNPEIAEEEVAAAIERVTAAVSSRGGEIVEVAPWGRRKLAYPINRHLEGNYVVTQIRLDPARAHELESGFAISDDVIRHLLIRKDED